MIFNRVKTMLLLIERESSNGQTGDTGPIPEGRDITRIELKDRY